MIFTIPLVAVEIVARWESRRFRWTIYPLAGLTLTIWLAAHLILIGIDFGFKDFQHPLRDFIGWNTIAEETKILADNDENDEILLAVPNWSYASRIAWYRRPYPVKVLDERFDQFDLWFQAIQPGQSTYLISTHSDHLAATPYLQQFTQCELVKTTPIYQKKTLSEEFSIYRCTQYLG